MNYLWRNNPLTLNNLPLGMVELYADVAEVAAALQISFLVVGAMARDLILVHGFGARISRGTRDVDFGMKVRSWDDFQQLSNALLGRGFLRHQQIQHRFSRNDSSGLPWELDIVPFGFATDLHEIAWPPSHEVIMNVLGFDEALHAAIQVTINQPQSPQTAPFTINVASPAGIGVLKLIAWLERDQHIRQKDAADLLYLISTYHKIPAVFTALYDDGYMAANQWDDLRASAQKLGIDMATLASPQTKAYLIDNLITDPAKLTTLARQMKLSGHESIDDCIAYLQCLLRGFSETP